MKNRIKIKLTAITLVICMLLSGSLMPIWAADSLTKESTATESKVQESIIPEEDIALEQVDLLAKEDEALWKFIDRESPSAEKHTARLAALEEPDTFVFQNSDGTRTVYFMEEDVKYVDSNGSTVIKDISLTKANNGFGIERNDVDILIPDKLTSGVDISLADYSVKLIPQNTATNILPEQKNNSVVYNGVFGEKTALVYTPVLSGIKEDIVLSEYTENASYTFILKTNGLLLRNRDGKYCLFSLSKKDPVFYLGEILVYDSIGKPDMGSMTVETIEEGQEYLLTVTASDEFLSDPDTVYPVTIDPSISSSDSTTSGAIEDAVIFENRPTENFGNYVYNRVGTPSASYGVGRTVVRLRGLLDSDVWAELHPYNVESLYFYATEATGSGSQTIMIYPLYNNTTWTETGVTWNDIGNVGWYTSYDATMSYNQEAAFNITSFATQWKYGDLPAEAGFIMLNSNESLDKSFCSSEYSNSSMRPRVVMTYTPMKGGNSFANATSLTSGDYVTANLTSSSDKKYFKFVPSATGFYTIESRENFGDPYVRLYNNEEQIIKYDNNSAGYSNFRLTYHLVANVTYYFQISCTSSGVGLFTFTLSSTNNTSYISANTMNFDNLNYAVQNAVPYTSTFYKFTPAESGIYLFYSFSAYTDPIAWLYNSNLSLIEQNDNGAGNNDFRISANLTVGQTYYIVAGQNGTDIYPYIIKILKEATIATDTYHLINNDSKLYLDIHGPNEQQFLHQWSFHAGAQNNWIVSKDNQNYYTIQSKYGNMYFVGVTTPASVGTNNVKLFLNTSVNTQWRIYRNSVGELFLEPRVAEGMLLYAPNNTEGTELQLTYLSNFIIRASWLLQGFDYSFTVEHYYDEGFLQRYFYWVENPEILTHYYQDIVAKRFYEIFNVDIEARHNLYTSSADNCKKELYIDGVSQVTINQECTHDSNHLTTMGLRADLDNGTPQTSVVIWTGHIMADNVGDRSNSAPWLHSVVMTPWFLYEYIFNVNGLNINNVSYEDIETTYLYTLMHELSHELGAEDHYCYGKNGNNRCDNYCCDICVNGRDEIRDCLMGTWYSSSSINDEDVYCSDCLASIRAHLAEHH